MEPFGMFQFLKTLLSSPEQATEKGGMQTSENAEKKPPSKSTVDGEILQAEQENTSNAFLDFARAHDARARKTKK